MTKMNVISHLKLLNYTMKKDRNKKIKVNFAFHNYLKSLLLINFTVFILNKYKSFFYYKFIVKFILF